jgi:hypothetical protein
MKVPSCSSPPESRPISAARPTPTAAIIFQKLQVLSNDFMPVTTISATIGRPDSSLAEIYNSDGWLTEDFFDRAIGFAIEH